MPPLLEVDRLTVALHREGGRRMVLDQVSLAVQPGQVMGVLGEGGSGKTTLAKAMIGWVPPPLQAEAGAVRLRGADLLTMGAAERRRVRARIGYIGADPASALDPTLPVGVQVAERLRAVKPALSPAAARQRVIGLLDAVRIPSAARRYLEYPSQYSGGMLQRALIVDALAADPELLICDNITQSLDVTVAAQIIRLLRELRARLAGGIVFITASLPLLAEIADDAVVLSAGRVVETQPPQGLAHAPIHAATRELLARTPRIWGVQTWPIARATDPQPVLRVDGVSKTYRVRQRDSLSRQAVHAVRGVSFDVFRGDNFGLVGESGCGKSTLSRLLSSLEAPDQGRILFEGRDVASLDRRERLAMRRGFQLVLQDPYNAIAPHLPVGRSIGLGLAVHGEPRRRIAERVRAVMDEVGLSHDDAGRLPVGMSAGQRQRVNIARALILEPKLIILDETLSALDPVEQARLLDLFERLQARHGLTYLFISHDLAMVRRVCTRIAVMYLGRLAEVADVAGIFADPAHPYTKALLSAMPTLDARPYQPEDCLLDGEPPNPIDLPPGCSFASRCPRRVELCHRADPPLVAREPGRSAACHVTAPAPLACPAPLA